MRACWRASALPLVALQLAACVQITELNLGWHFTRGDGAFADPAYNDTHWQIVDVPNDWSSGDLPPRDEDRSTPVIEVRSGAWRFIPRVGDSSFAEPSFDDSSWAEIVAPSDWHSYGVNYWNVTGWFRRHVHVTSAQLALAQTGELRLALGAVASADRTYVNGQQVGGEGTFFKGQHSCADALTTRSYGGAKLAAALREGDNLIAINVWSANGPLGKDASFAYAKGALPAGGDVEPPRSMDVSEAIARCNATDGCYGITFRAARKRPASPVKVYFKSERVANGGKGWHSWVVLSGQPGGLVDPEPPGDSRVGPFDPGASPGQRQTGYSVGGIGWYRRTFTTPPIAGSHMTLLFEGCYMNCTVYINGRALAHHPYGYTLFEVPLPRSILARPGQLNYVAVRVANTGLNSRWYSGSGLFRPVRLVTYPEVHLIPSHRGGVHVMTPQVDLHDHTNGTVANATANFSVALANNGSMPSAPTRLRILVCGESESIGEPVIASGWFDVPPIGAAASTTLHGLVLPLGLVKTWSPDQPSRYSAAVCLETGCPPMGDGSKCPAERAATDAAGVPTAEVRTSFGVRSFTFSSAAGLVLNGRSVKLRGGCVHHANGPLGSRAIPRAEERRVELLKAAGYNAIRTSHNPPSQAFVAACDRLGVILMVEAFDTWRDGKNPQDYHLYFDEWWRHDMATMVLRDRNAPSVLLWSIGNEIGMRTTAEGAELCAQLARFVRTLDPAVPGGTRAVTSAVPGIGTDAFFAPLDVAGYNYAIGLRNASLYDRDHARVPSRVIVATETFPVNSVADWQAAAVRPFVIGNFLWTAIDYLGESGLGANGNYEPSPLACGASCSQPYPYHISFCGDFDLVGEPKAQSRLRRVMWGVSPLELSVHRPGVESIAAWGFRDEQQTWTWPGLPSSATELTVRAYASSGCVVLTLNGRAVAGGIAGDDAPTSSAPSAPTFWSRRHRRRLLNRRGLPTDVHCINASNATDFTATWHVPYQAGELRATRYDSQDAAVAAALPPLVTPPTVAFRTAGPPVRIVLTADRTSLLASRDDLAYVRAELVDAAGVRVQCGLARPASAGSLAAHGARLKTPFLATTGLPDWDHPQRFAYSDASDEFATPPSWCLPAELNFTIAGEAAELAAVGTGDPLDLASFQGPSRRTYRGVVTAIVRPGRTAVAKQPGRGVATLTVTANGLQGASLKITIG